MVPSTLSSLNSPVATPPPTPTFQHRNPNHRADISSPLPPPPPRALGFRCACRLRGRSWDSNAESVRPGRFRFRDEAGGGREGEGGFWKREKRRWWSDEEEFEEPFDDDDDDDEEEEIEQPWERIWIFKVFKAYGYLLPAIIASMLLATGPKAFLMALALPLGQSALSLAIEKVFGSVPEGPRNKPWGRRKPFSRSASDFKWQKQAETSEDVGKPWQGYQSWVSGEVPDKESSSCHPSFGGWDELDRQERSSQGSIKRQRPSTNRSSQISTDSKEKLSQGGRFRDVPLFLRLLIAVFPFLGSWTRIF